ncbi:MAG: ATP-dependent zinc metalloprotease FtsH [Oscillospiraceae bacterium]|nr:ATP-dependent zinc metalloprotease FtsH [Oscillospiraceae bacterium]
MNQNKNKGLLAYLAFATIIIIAMLIAFSSFASQADKTTYSDILGYFDNLQVSEFTFDRGTGKLEYKLEGTDEVKTYKVPNVEAFYNEIFGNGENDFNYRKEYNATHETPLVYEVVTSANVGGIILSIIPSVLLIGGMLFLTFIMFRNLGPGGKNPVGKARIRTDADIVSKVTFNDVAGADEEKAELEEIVELLKNPQKYRDIGAKIPKGVLLVGPPGNGKTLLAKAVAGEAGVPFFSLSGSDFVELYVGAGAARVRDLFDQAKKSAPSIVFIDEIDAVGRHRGAGLGGGHDEREQTLNQLLVEMDGFTGDAGVIVLAATNRRDVLDPALLRPGRFDRQVYVNYPDIKGREAILKVHAKNKPLAPDVDLKTIAGTTSGFTGADLANLMNEAALLAAKRGKKAITAQDLADASTKVMVGPEKRSRVITQESKKLTAYHEAGHALCYYYCPTQDKVGEISIVPTGFAGGYTMAAPEQDKDFITKTEMQERIITLLGGRAAEKIVLDDISTGASNDLERATKIARSMVTKYGFSDKIGPVVYGAEQDEVFLGRDYNTQKAYSEKVASEIDNEMREIVHSAYNSAIDILSQHIGQLHTVAQYLIKHEKLNGEQFERLMNGEALDTEPTVDLSSLNTEIPDVQMPSEVVDTQDNSTEN